MLEEIIALAHGHRLKTRDYGMDSKMPITYESDDYSSAMFGNFDTLY